MSAIRSIPVVDGLLAATAKTHALTLATRNASDLHSLGAADRACPLSHQISRG